MRQSNIRHLVAASLLAALVCAATIVIKIPLPSGGYINAGDCFVLLSGWLLGPFYGAAVAGAGSAIADLLSGYAAFAPITLIIKALCALIAAFCHRSESRFFSLIGGGILAEAEMIIGYFVFSVLLTGNSGTAVISLAGDGIQGAAGILLAAVLYRIIERRHLCGEFFSER